MVLGLQADILGSRPKPAYPVPDMPPDALLLGLDQLEKVVEATGQFSGDKAWEYGDDLLLDSDDGCSYGCCSCPAGEEAIEEAVEPLVPDEFRAATRRAASQLLLVGGGGVLLSGSDG
ncbi:hypothetical protein PG988_009042 [Apiospora saccharicola]